MTLHAMNCTDAPNTLAHPARMPARSPTWARALCLLLGAFTAAGGAPNAHAATAQANAPTEHLETALIAEDSKVAPGGEVIIGLRLKPEAGWHVYWRNPGDSGLPTKIRWTLPAGTTAGDIQWPYPELATLGTLVNYGYGDDTVLLVPIRVASDATPGQKLNLVADVNWLICKDLCIPGKASYSLPLEIGAKTEADPAQAALFAQARATLPLPMPPDWQAHFAIEPPTGTAPGAAPADDPVAATAGRAVTLALSHAWLPAGAELSFFPIPKKLIQYGAPQRIAREGQDLRLSQALSPEFTASPDTFDGVLVARSADGTRAYEISATRGAALAVPISAAPSAGSGTAEPTSWSKLLSAVAFAMLGGLILNLMPCVFPVLSLKALALAQAGGQAAAHRQRDALAYTGGVLVSFLGVAALLIALRATGQAFGWGFQLQSPTFVAILAEVMFALGLSMSGLAMFGTRLMGVGQQLTERGGVAGAFFTGVLAAVVASPCSAPYMGTALGFALTQPPAGALLIFAGLGIGMASPFLLIGFVPSVARMLPRPGIWMETFKQFLAFPLYLTSAWLIWVLARQVGADGAGLALGGLVLIGFGLWVSQLPRREDDSGRLSSVLAFSAFLAALALTAAPAIRLGSADAKAATTLTNISSNAHAQPYSDEALAALRAAHRTVFVNFTADWCLSCKVNEHGALRADRVTAAFSERKVAWLEGDWTRYDPAITHILERFGRSGVPLYLVYRDGVADPEVLPQILTPDILVEALTAKTTP